MLDNKLVKPLDDFGMSIALVVDVRQAGQGEGARPRKSPK
jgi:hypothetical protein